jgi:hypothetical protein
MNEIDILKTIILAVKETRGYKKILVALMYVLFMFIIYNPGIIKEYPLLWCISFVLLVVLIVVMSILPERDKEPEQLINSFIDVGKKNMKDEDFIEARKSFKQAIKYSKAFGLDGKEMESLRNLSLVFYCLNDYRNSCRYAKEWLMKRKDGKDDEMGFLLNIMDKCTSANSNIIHSIS